MKILILLMIGFNLYAEFIQNNIKINGETQHIYIQNTNSSKSDSEQPHIYYTRQGKSFDSNSELLIIFNDDLDSHQISEFENKYNLIYRQKLILGYYQFKNNSSIDTLELINTIMTNSANIKTIKPNWKMNVNKL